MKTILVASSLISLLCSCREHAQTGFTVNLINTSVTKSVSDFAPGKPSIYEDADFLIYSSCAGEFGGGLQLTSKRTGRIYGCFATCPLALYKVNSKYVVVTTLAHGSGFSSIIEIENPYGLKEFKTEVLAGQRCLKPATNDPGFKHGTRQLADTMNLLTVSSFTREGKLYHIMSDFKETFLATNNRKKFIIIRKLADFSTFNTSQTTPTIIRLANERCITFYNNSSAHGYVEVHGDTINLVRYQTPGKK